MNINIVNCPKAIRKKVNHATKFYFECLVKSKRLRNNSTITINFNYSKKDVAFVDLDEYNTRKKPRGFVISLSRLDEKTILKTIAHEMVHVKQYLLEEINESLTTWKENIIDRNNVNYFDLPWEKEAYEKEEVLYFNFLKGYENED